MRVDLDARVRTRDGEDAGSVQAAVVDPRTNEITDFVVNTGGFLGRDVLVPRAEIDRAREDGDAIRLQLTKEELEALPAYTHDRYVTPPPGWIAPDGYGFPVGGFLWPAGYIPTAPYYPGPMPVQTPPPPATDPNAPVAGAAGDERNEVNVDKGAMVIDARGNDIGVVDEVRFDPGTGRLQGLVIRIGGPFRTFFGGGDTAEVGAAGIDRVGDGIVYLRISKEEAARAGRG